MPAGAARKAPATAGLAAEILDAAARGADEPGSARRLGADADDTGFDTPRTGGADTGPSGRGRLRGGHAGLEGPGAGDAGIDTPATGSADTGRLGTGKPAGRLRASDAGIEDTDTGAFGADGRGPGDSGLAPADDPGSDDDVIATAAGAGRIELVVEPGAAAERLDAALARRLAARPDGALSRSRLKALVLEGRVAVDGATVDDPARKINAGARIALDLPAPAAAAPEPEPIPLEVVYEDGELIVIDKPAGLVVHPGAGHGRGTLVNALLAHCGASLSGIGGVLRPGIVHRLDKDTSGLMVVAKTDRAHRALAAQFADHGVTGPLERAYLAVVWGSPRQRAGTVDLPLGRNPRDRETMAVVRGPAGRRAVTRYERLASWGEPGAEPVASLVECRLETGRTHQIRVHMAELGHPLLGDPVYGTGFKTKIGKLRRLSPAAAEALEALGRQALHARLLAFAHPKTGRTLRFESPPPPDMARLIAALEAIGGGAGG